MIKSFVKWNDAILSILFFLGLAILPLVFWPWAPIPYEIPKVWFVQRWIEVLGLVGFLELIISLSRVKYNRSVVITLSIFILTALISSFFGANLQKSIAGNYYRGDGLITLFHLVGLFLFVLFYYKKTWQFWTVMSITFGNLAVSLLTIIDGVKLFLLNDQSLNVWKGALGSTFGQPKFLTGYLLITLPLIVAGYHLMKGKWKLFFVITGLLQITAIFLTRSWAGVMGVVIFTGLYIVLFHKKGRKSVIVAGILGLLLAGLISLYVFHLNQRPYSVEGRGRIFETLFLGIKERPLMGWGWANVDYAFGKYVSPVNVYVDKAHSHLLEALTTGGILGLSAYLALLFLIGKSLWQKSEKVWFKTLFLVFILYILHTQTNVVSIAEEVIFWYIAGISAQNKHS